MVIHRWSGEAFLFKMKANIMSVLSEEMSFSQTDLTNAWSDFHSLLEYLCIFHLNTMSNPNICFWKCSVM